MAKLFINNIQYSHLGFDNCHLVKLFYGDPLENPVYITEDYENIKKWVLAGEAVILRGKGETYIQCGYDPVGEIVTFVSAVRSAALSAILPRAVSSEGYVNAITIGKLTGAQLNECYDYISLEPLMYKKYSFKDEIFDSEGENDWYPTIKAVKEASPPLRKVDNTTVYRNDQGSISLTYNILKGAYLPDDSIGNDGDIFIKVS